MLSSSHTLSKVLVSPAFNHMISPPLKYQSTSVSRWLGVVPDWCMLAEAGLSVVEAMSLSSHLVNLLECALMCNILLVKKGLYRMQREPY